MKALKTLIAASALVASLPAAAEMAPVTTGDEVQLAWVTLPVNTVGRVIYRTCDTCERKSARVNPATEYYFNDRRYELDEFRKLVAGVRNRQVSDAFIGVYVDTGFVAEIYVTELDSAQ